MTESTRVVILREILCTLMDWLKREARKTDTPIDDMVVRVLEVVLGCERDKKEVL